MTKKTMAAKASPMDDWQTEDDLRHLTKAHQIKSDPKRHKNAMNLARTRIQEMKDATAMQPDDPAAEA